MNRSVLPPISAGLVTAFAGFASTFAVILKGLSAAGATDAQAASGLIIGLGLGGKGFLELRNPLVPLKDLLTELHLRPGA